ncbi:dihydrofolate reductase [Vibrio phage 1.081.O._10N.286.52.C2]|nr:dihydrofolate reductase [Vibrio phage 1.081.O._10N.286.52.C2]
MKLQIVFAHAFSKSPHAPFGNKNSLPWKHNRNDLMNFKRITDGSVLVMGSNTFKSLPGKLVGRPHVVLSDTNTAVTESGSAADLYTSMAISDLIEEIKSVYLPLGYDTISVIGGPSVIRQFLDYADCIYKTTIVEEIEQYDVTIDLAEITMKFPYRGTSELIDDGISGNSITYFEKLTKGDL